MKLTRNCTEPFGKALSSITGSLVGEGRVYGGGLHKLEPKEPPNVTADFIVTALPRARDIKLYSQRELFTGDTDACANCKPNPALSDASGATVDLRLSVRGANGVPDLSVVVNLGRSLNDRT